jgi:multimeric flavodoxin WrbA
LRLTRRNDVDRRRLLIVAHAPSDNTRRLLDAVKEGARSAESETVEVVAINPFAANVDDVLRAKAIILGTTENIGYMSGALKDFFDRIYDPCLERTQGLPYAAYIRGRSDGTGTRRGIETIAAGLRWRAVHEPLICRGKWEEAFVDQCRELGAAVAAGLDLGIF